MNPAVARRCFGSFEQYHTVAPRYFKVSYYLDQRKYREKVTDSDTKDVALEHRELVVKAIQEQKILFRGEAMPKRESKKEDGAQ